MKSGIDSTLLLFIPVVDQAAVVGVSGEHGPRVEGVQQLVGRLLREAVKLGPERCAPLCRMGGVLSGAIGIRAAEEGKVLQEDRAAELVVTGAQFNRKKFQLEFWLENH